MRIEKKVIYQLNLHRPVPRFFNAKITCGKIKGKLGMLYSALMYLRAKINFLMLKITLLHFHLRQIIVRGSSN